MCKLLEDMVNEVKADAMAQGKEQGKFFMLVKLFQNGALTLPQAASNAGMTEQEFCRKMKESEV